MSTSTAEPAAVDRWTAWIETRLAGLTAPLGNLALIETRWYEPGTSVPQGDLVAGSDTVTVTTLRRTDLDSGLPQEGIRRWDSGSEAIRAFDGVDRYPYDPAWVIAARYVPGDAGRTVSFEHMRDNGGTRELVVPGEILVRIADVDYRLNAFDDGGVLLLVFGDPTNGDETYGSGRFLFIDLAEFGDEGDIELDLNRAFVPPCGFSDQFNCPLPPVSNRIAVPVRAGERVPRFAEGFAH